MKTLEIDKIPCSLLEYVQDLGDEGVILTYGRTPLAVLLPVHDADLETVSLSLNPKFLAIIERSKRRLDREGGISTEEMRRRLELPPQVKQHRNASHPKAKSNTRSKKSTDQA